MLKAHWQMRFYSSSDINFTIDNALVYFLSIKYVHNDSNWSTTALRGLEIFTQAFIAGTWDCKKQICSCFYSAFSLKYDAVPGKKTLASHPWFVNIVCTWCPSCRWEVVKCMSSILRICIIRFSELVYSLF